MIASTPLSTREVASTGSFTVQTMTAIPSRWQTSIAWRATTRWSNVAALAPTVRGEALELAVQTRRAAGLCARMRDQEPADDVELDDVGAVVDTAMTDAQHSAVAAQKLHQAVRRITTTARSSEISPRAKARASSVTSRASSAGERSLSAASSESSRSVP